MGAVLSQTLDKVIEVVDAVEAFMHSFLNHTHGIPEINVQIPDKEVEFTDRYRTAPRLVAQSPIVKIIPGVSTDILIPGPITTTNTSSTNTTTTRQSQPVDIDQYARAIEDQRRAAAAIRRSQEAAATAARGHNDMAESTARRATARAQRQLIAANAAAAAARLAVERGQDDMAETTARQRSSSSTSTQSPSQRVAFTVPARVITVPATPILRPGQWVSVIKKKTIKYEAITVGGAGNARNTTSPETSQGTRIIDDSLRTSKSEFTKQINDLTTLISAARDILSKKHYLN